MILIAGLGNPGPRYGGNRHNIGFMAADRIARRHGFPAWRRRFQAEAAEGTIAGERVLLLKPDTYMNESGRSVGEAAKFLKIPLTDVIVLHDELDLPPGKVRVKTGGGHGGHNGLRSIDSLLTPGYRRVRLGIGHPGDKALVTHYVLGDFAKADGEWLEKLLDAVADNADLLVKGNDTGFANKLALAGAPPKPKAVEMPVAPAAKPAVPRGETALGSALRGLFGRKAD
jgi:PTH1 family peptidyl-tRNA hydrolase